MRSPRRHLLFRRAGDVARITLIALVAFGGYQAAASDGVQSPSATWIPDISIPQVSLPDISMPDLGATSDADQLWRWRGASPGDVRTVSIDIDESIYPTDGVHWIHNSLHDRSDLYGPLDEELGLWHSSTRSLDLGDVVTACWHSIDGTEHCPSIIVR